MKTTGQIGVAVLLVAVVAVLLWRLSGAPAEPAPVEPTAPSPHEDESSEPASLPEPNPLTSRPTAERAEVERTPIDASTPGTRVPWLAPDVEKAVLVVQVVREDDGAGVAQAVVHVWVTSPASDIRIPNGVLGRYTMDEHGSRELVVPAGVPLALVGVPLWGAHRELYRLVEEAGGEVVLDGTKTGERGLPAPYDRRSSSDDPLLEIAAAHHGSMVDAFRRPNHRLYQWLDHGLREREVRGIVFLRCAWCDMWHGELGRLTEWSPVPVVDVDLSGDRGGLARMETRIQALLDVIR